MEPTDMAEMLKMSIPGIPVADLPRAYEPTRDINPAVVPAIPVVRQFIINDEFITEPRRPPKLDVIKEEEVPDLVSPVPNKGKVIEPIPSDEYRGRGYQTLKPLVAAKHEESKITEEMYDSLHAYTVGTELYYIDMINGFIVPLDKVHEQYKKTLLPQPMKPVHNIFQISRINDKFVVVLLSGEEMVETNVIYERKTHIFTIDNFNPCVLIPAILKNPDFELYFMACEHPRTICRNYEKLYRHMPIVTYEEYVRYMREGLAERRAQQQHGVSYEDIYEDKDPDSSYVRSARAACVARGAGSDGGEDTWDDDSDPDDSYSRFGMQSPTANDDRPTITEAELKEVEELFKPDSVVDEHSGDTGRKGPIRDLHKRPYMGVSPYIEDGEIPPARYITAENEHMLEAEIRQQLEARRQLLGDRFDIAVQRQLVLRTKLAQLEELQNREGQLLADRRRLMEQTDSLKQQLEARSRYLLLKSKEEEEIEAAIKLSLETNPVFNMTSTADYPIRASIESESLCPVPPPVLPEREDNL